MNEEPIKLVPDEVEFWKAVWLASYEAALRERSDFWPRFNRTLEPCTLADTAVRELRSRR